MVLTTGQVDPQSRPGTQTRIAVIRYEDYYLPFRMFDLAHQLPAPENHLTVYKLLRPRQYG